ncbi:phosphotransferase family protein [Peribacillus sp. SCS-37]|uniref:phosphotransferase family protein n=1 Tax=Paraperibacillus esterisolvens TaxID=3115296 RepID=UPI003905A3E5
MKSGWERSGELILLEAGRADHMLRPFLKERHVRETLLLGGGLNNTNLKITTDSEEVFVLRLYSQNHEACAIERKIAGLLKGKVPAADVLYTDDTCEKADVPFLLMNFVPGVQLSEIILRKDSRQMKKAAWDAGRHLAQIHSLKFDGPGFFDGDLHIREPVSIGSGEFVAFISKSLKEGYGGKNLGLRLTEKVIRFCERHAVLLEELTVQNCLVHSDFNPLNILVEDHGRIAAVLDWEYAFSGTPLFDIGNMVRYECLGDTILLQPFITGYKEYGGRLPERWLQMAKLVDLIALCGLLDKEACGEVRSADIRRLIQGTMDDWEKFASLQAKMLAVIGDMK